MAENNNANNVISNNDFANFGDLQILECALTTSFKEFTFLNTPAQIFIDNTPGTDVDSAATNDIDVKFASAQTNSFRVSFGVKEDFTPYRSASIFLKSVSGNFKVNLGYYVKGTQTIV